jgi:integrase
VGFAEKRGDYWRGRYKVAPGQYATVVDAAGRVEKFRSKRAAANAADEAEAKVRVVGWRDPRAGRETFADFANRWYSVQDLAPSTMQNYKRHIEEHLLPAFGEIALADITPANITSWVRRERAVPYAESSIKTWRATLHLILADAVEEGLRDSNPAATRRGRGRRAGRSRNRQPEKPVTDALGILLLAERMALLSGRDDEFVAGVLLGYTGLRWAELVGLEPEYLRGTSLRVEWQLYELDTGELHRCPPKDDSYRTVDLPSWLGALTNEQLARARGAPCACHGRRYVFSAHRPVRGAPRRVGPRLVDIAREAGVSTGTVSNVLNRPDTVRATIRTKVEAAVKALDGTMSSGGGTTGELAAHWRRSGFAAWLFQPAATGWYPVRAPKGAHPVPVLADVWPGAPARGRGAAARAEACWMPLAPGLTPHGLRHTHKTMMEELGTPPKLMDDRLGHEDGSVQARYSHVTDTMRGRLMEGLTELWERSLEARRRLSSDSPVHTVARLLSKAE